MNEPQNIYGRIEAMLAAGECIVLDGGVGSEVARGRSAALPGAGGLPDMWAIYDMTDRVLEVHRQYALAGCDVISTDTWGILGSIATERGRRPGRTGLPAWTVATRDAVSLARRTVEGAGRIGRCAVAFSLNDADPLLAGEEELLELLWTVDPPDLVLVETLRSIPSPALVSAIDRVVASRMPVWVSFQRASADRDEDPGAFRGAIRALERIGVRAVLVNCIAPAQTSAALAQLAASTSLPIGCYPRLDDALDPAAYGQMAMEWRARGAQIIGGCCGVGPEHIRAVRDGLSSSARSRS